MRQTAPSGLTRLQKASRCCLTTRFAPFESIVSAPRCVIWLSLPATSLYSLLLTKKMFWGAVSALRCAECVPRLSALFFIQIFHFYSVVSQVHVAKHGNKI